MVWSRRAQATVARFIADLPATARDPARTHSARLGALPIGGSMWADYYLRPTGEVVVVGEDYDHPDVDTVHTDRLQVLSALVWGAERYPELGELLPARPAGAADCRCREHPDVYGPGRLICGECGGMGWLIPVRAEPQRAPDRGGQ
jgi:hypothetical protein